MIKHVLLIILTLATYTLSAQTDDRTASNFTSQFKSLSSTIETIESDFTLTKSMSFLSSDIESKGKFYYIRGVGISLDFSEPRGDLITLGESKFKITIADKTNIVAVHSNPMLRQLKNMLTACMIGDIEMLENGSTITYEEQDNYYIVRMVPESKKQRKAITLITLTFDKADMSLAKMRMDESSGDSSEYVFFNKKFNGDVDDSRFQI